MFKRRLIDQIMPLFAAIIFISLLIGVLTKAIWLSQFNHLGQLVIQQRSPLSDTIWMAVTQIGSVLMAIALTSLITVGLIIQRQFHWLYFFVANVAIFAGLVTSIIKHWVQLPRPQPQLLPETGYSFPSGHSMVAVLLYGSILIYSQHNIKKYWIRQLITWGLFILILMIAISRVYLNVHYPSDVLAGLTLGWLLLKLSYHLFIGEMHDSHNT